jgi:hypothetical protein
MLKPQDIAVALQLMSSLGSKDSYPALGKMLRISASEAHAAVKRATLSGLLDKNRQPNRRALLEFLVHGLKYSFPAERKGITRGIPTSIAASPLSAEFLDDDLPPVWPHPRGNARGEGLVPLYKSAPDAALENPNLYEWLAIIDAVRSGRARERALATSELERRLK